MKETYFVIHNSEGDTTVEEISKETLLERIEERYWGNVNFLDSIPKDNDTNYWGENTIIIKGRIVTPNAEQIVTRYNIE